jgi:hypothetical protein
VLPSHGLPFVGVQSRVAALHAHHEERLQALEEACEIAPQSAAELLDVLFQRALDTHQTMFAMGEAIAHLNYLEQAGRLSRTTDADGVIRYTRRTALQPRTDRGSLKYDAANRREILRIMPNPAEMAKTYAEVAQRASRLITQFMEKKGPRKASVRRPTNLASPRLSWTCLRA